MTAGFPSCHSEFPSCHSEENPRKLNNALCYDVYGNRQNGVHPQKFSQKSFEYETEISKLYILNLDKLKKITAPLYSCTGRPSNFQPHLNITLDEWIFKLKKNPTLRTAIGVAKNNIPSASSHYDFINRLIKIDERPKIKVKKRKATKEFGKNVEMPNKHPKIVQKLVDKILCGRSFSLRPERTLQHIYADIPLYLRLVEAKRNDSVSAELAEKFLLVKICVIVLLVIMVELFTSSLIGTCDFSPKFLVLVICGKKK